MYFKWFPPQNVDRGRCSLGKFQPRWLNFGNSSWKPSVLWWKVADNCGHWKALCKNKPGEIVQLAEGAVQTDEWGEAPHFSSPPLELAFPKTPGCCPNAPAAGQREAQMPQGNAPSKAPFKGCFFLALVPSLYWRLILLVLLFSLFPHP